MMKAISAREAKRIGEMTGFPISEGDGRTYYATDEYEDEVWEFDTKKERDEFVKRSYFEAAMAQAESIYGGAI